MKAFPTEAVRRRFRSRAIDALILLGALAAALFVASALCRMVGLAPLMRLNSLTSILPERGLRAGRVNEELPARARQP